MAVSPDAFDEYRGLDFMESRIPVLDGLTAFVADGSAPSPEVATELARHGQSRWYPVPGGHKVMVPREWDSYDSEHFAVEAGAWDHDHCSRCGDTIQAMTLFWVTRSGPYVALCVDCKAKMDATGGRTRG
jgi:hypothetical protein